MSADRKPLMTVDCGARPRGRRRAAALGIAPGDAAPPNYTARLWIPTVPKYASKAEATARTRDRAAGATSLTLPST
jgi:hypothetical protein